jgi:hypothetical protein
MTTQHNRRMISLTLPTSDPNSYIIARWLDALPRGTDACPLIRQALAKWLEIGPLIERMAAQLDQIASGQVVMSAPGPPEPPDEETVAVLNLMLDFDHLT